MAPRKVRAVSELIVGMDYVAARELLEHTPRKAARPLVRLLDSAAANGHNNFNLVKENLYVKKITVDEGMKLKRMRPKGFGSASRIEKKTSHVKLVLDERIKGLVRKAEDKKAAAGIAKEASDEKKAMPEIKKEIGREKGFFGGLKKKMFRRKAI